MSTSSDPIVVVGANGFVGARVCAALLEREAPVRAVVRRAGTAPDGTEEVVGDFTDAGFAETIVAGARAVVSTVHPMGSDRETQERVGVQGTATLAQAAASAGVARLIHISTAAVYDRSPGMGDVDESSPLVADDAGDYAVTKRDTDAALGEIGGITRVLLRPPAILGAGPTSVWNTLRPAGMREHESARHAVPGATWAWVHVTDLASLAADLALEGIGGGEHDGRCVAVNVAAPPATQRDYFGTVCTALGVDPVWDAEPAWTGAIVAARARDWGWRPAVDLTQALDELAAGLR